MFYIQNIYRVHNVQERRTIMRYLKYAKIKRNGDECSIHIEREDGTLDCYGTYQFMSEEFTKDLEKLAHDGYTVEWEGK